jgi:hypothetical protein
MRAAFGRQRLQAQIGHTLEMLSLWEHVQWDDLQQLIAPATCAAAAN